MPLPYLLVGMEGIVGTEPRSTQGEKAPITCLRPIFNQNFVHLIRFGYQCQGILFAVPMSQADTPDMFRLQYWSKLV